MTTASLSEIVERVCEISSKTEKVEWLLQNNSLALRNLLKIMYDPSVELNIPSTPPPYTSSEFPDSHGALYRESRKFVYFVKGHDGDNLTSIRREAVFIQMLESVDKADSDLLIKMIAQKPIKGLTGATINLAFGDNFVPQKKYGKDG